MRGIGCEHTDWTGLAPDMVKFWAFMDMVMNFWVAQHQDLSEQLSSAQEDPML
jgi:hypothetical protein